MMKMEEKVFSSLLLPWRNVHLFIDSLAVCAGVQVTVA
jgi:hypothetical protein